MGVRKIRKKVALALDYAKLALVGQYAVLGKLRYFVTFALLWLVLFLLISFFQDGGSSWQLLWSGLPLGDKLAVLGRSWSSAWESLGSGYGLALALMTGLQAMTIALLTFAWRHRDKENVIDGASTGGIASVLGLLALGCPSCGMSLLTPLLTAAAGSGAVVLAEGIGATLLVLAFLLLIYTVIKLGYIVFILASSEQRRE